MVVQLEAYIPFVCRNPHYLFRFLAKRGGVYRGSLEARIQKLNRRRDSSVP